MNAIPIDLIQLSILLPACLVRWSIDAISFLVIVRFVFGFGNSPAARANHQSACHLTDPLPRLVQSVFAKRGYAPPLAWRAWVIVILVCLVVRELAGWTIDWTY
jgi:hypothetical protein